MPDNNDSLLNFVRNPNTISETEKTYGMTQGMKELMGGEVRGVLPPIQHDAQYVYTMVDPTTGEKLPYFRVTNQAHPSFGSDIGAKSLIQQGLNPQIPDIGSKIKEMTAAGASTEEMENAIQEIQNVHSAIAQEARLGFGQIVRNGLNKILTGGFSGAIMPPNIGDLISIYKKESPEGIRLAGGA